MTADIEAKTPKNRLEISILLDYYGALLSDRQREVLEFYYNDDMSLSEIASETGITRQGVRDAISKGRETLVKTEEKLSLAQRFEERQELIDKLVEGLVELEKAKKEKDAAIEKLLDLAKQLQKEE